LRQRAPADYGELVRELFPRLTGGVRWGLERTRALLASVGDPHERLRAIHVAGTNGKGSVAATAESILRAGGLRTGLYTSPHLTSFRERVRVDGTPVDEATLLDAARELWPAVRAEEPTFFEATTALAFLVLERAGVDAAVVEVGLGGRLDATNVLSAPLATVVTQVTRDHVDFLGTDLAGIAREKAGIAKRDVPMITAETDAVALDALRATAATAGAPFETLGPDAITDVRARADATEFTLRTGTWGELRLRSPLLGEYQARNVALAVRAVERSGLIGGVDARAVVDGVAATRWPGRMQRVERDRRLWLFDVAHNPAGARALVASLEACGLPRPWHAAVGILGDKEWPAMLETLAGALDRLILTRPAHAPTGRGWDPADAARHLAAQRGRARVEVVADLPAALAALDGAAAGTRIVTGSFHTVGEALVELDVPLGWAPDPAAAAAT